MLFGFAEYIAANLLLRHRRTWYVLLCFGHKPGSGLPDCNANKCVCLADLYPEKIFGFANLVSKNIRLYSLRCYSLRHYSLGRYSLGCDSLGRYSLSHYSLGVLQLGVYILAMRKATAWGSTAWVATSWQASIWHVAAPKAGE